MFNYGVLSGFWRGSSLRYQGYFHVIERGALNGILVFFAIDTGANQRLIIYSTHSTQ